MPGPKNETGYIYMPQAVEKFVATNKNPFFKGTLEDTGRGKIQLLHKYVEKVAGKIPIANQGIGDCVSHAGANAVDHTYCAQIATGSGEIWTGRTASEVLYGFSRVEIGKRQLGNGDGSCGAWLAEALKTKGSLPRKKYDTIDLTNYDSKRAKEWGYKGVPDSIEPAAFENRILTAALITSYYQAIDALWNGYAIVVCAGQGFTNVRDKDGFARPQGRWNHAQAIIGYDDDYKRPGVLVLNSWGPNWITGPKRHDQPDGSYFVDADDIEKMFTSFNDSYAISGYDGFPGQDLDFTLF